MSYWRDTSIDVLRGIAILAMIAPNLAASILVEPHPLWLRFYGSFSAPLFILISGMMISYTAQSRGYRLGHFLLRCLMIMVVAVLVDILVWKIYPFTTFDVLYLIGVSAPLVYLFLRLKPPVRWAVVLLIFLVTPILQAALGYTNYPTEFTLLGQQTIVVSNETSILNHWLIDGWFPIFPWLGFSFLGAALADIRWGHKAKTKTEFAKKEVFLSGLGILVLGAVVWWSYSGSLLVRAGYSELFYPPTIGYVLTAVGLILVLLALVDRTASSLACRPLQAMGESSLLIYILHLALIEYIIGPFLPPESIEAFLVVYVILLVGVALSAYVLRALKAKRKPGSYAVRFLLGS